MTLAEAKIAILAAVDEDAALFRAAVEALPDRALLNQLSPLLQALVETRLFQLVPVGVAN